MLEPPLEFADRRIRLLGEAESQLGLAVTSEPMTSHSGKNRVESIVYVDRPERLRETLVSDVTVKLLVSGSDTRGADDAGSSDVSDVRSGADSVGSDTESGDRGATITGFYNGPRRHHEHGSETARPHSTKPFNITLTIHLTDSETDSDSVSDSESCPLAADDSEPAQLCASEITNDTCVTKCGVGASGRCQWRPPPLSLYKTPLYGTCSSDLRSCPDGRCDALERLSSGICPQDCAGQCLLLVLQFVSRISRSVWDEI